MSCIACMHFLLMKHKRYHEGSITEIQGSKPQTVQFRISNVRVLETHVAPINTAINTVIIFPPV
jgi:hypothetical protein